MLLYCHDILLLNFVNISFIITTFSVQLPYLTPLSLLYLILVVHLIFFFFFSSFVYFVLYFNGVSVFTTD